MINKRYLGKLAEEVELISENYYEIGTEDEPAYYFKMKDSSESAIVQLKETSTGFVFSYSIIVKKLEMDSIENILRNFSKNWSKKEIYLWPMEINEEWYLLASKKSFFETYLPGQIISALDIVRKELQIELEE